MRARGAIAWVVLVAAAAHIWMRDLRWLDRAADVLPVALAWPVVWWWGRPWRIENRAADGRLLVVAGLLFVGGSYLGSTIVLAVAWTTALWGVIAPALPRGDRRTRGRLVLLTFLAFPWMALDGEPLGWWFRLTGAACVESWYSMVGFGVVREGTELIVAGLRVSVSAPCSGLNLLQATLLAGGLVFYLQLGRTRWYGLALVLLFPLAWFANTIRIAFVVGAALTFQDDQWFRWLHDYGVLIVAMTMFMLCWWIGEWGRRHAPAMRT